MTKYTVAVAGATGYAGGEALRILAAHPAFEVTAVAGHSSIGIDWGIPATYSATRGSHCGGHYASRARRP